MTDIESEIRSALAETAEATEIPDFPELGGVPIVLVPRRSRRRRIGAAAAATCLVVGSGAGVAAAVVDFIPTPLGHDAFGFAYYAGEPHDPHAVPGTAHLILEVKGPHGAPLRFRVAKASTGDGYCSELSDRQNGVSSVAGCSGRAITAFGQIGPMTGDSSSKSGGVGATEFSAAVPGATTVRLFFADGTSKPLAVADGFTIGWFTEAQSLEGPQLVGYDTSGKVIGRADVPSGEQRKKIACQPHC